MPSFHVSVVVRAIPRSLPILIPYSLPSQAAEAPLHAPYCTSQSFRGRPYRRPRTRNSHRQLQTIVFRQPKAAPDVFRHVWTSGGDPAVRRGHADAAPSILSSSTRSLNTLASRCGLIKSALQLMGRYSTNRAESGLRSAARNNKATRLLTRPVPTSKSSARDSSQRAIKLQYALRPRVSCEG